MLGASSFAVEGPLVGNVIRIPVHLTQRISSQDARTGDTFTFDTSSSSEVDGMFLAAHTHGRGVVVLARSAKGPMPGALVLEARTLDTPDGKTVDVALDTGQLDRTIVGDVRRYPGNNGSIGSVPFSIGSSRSTNVVYDKGTEFVVFTPPPPSPEPDETP